MLFSKSRTRLTKAGKGKGALYNSLGYSVNESKLNTKLAFKALGYAKFVDQGVKGADPSKVSPNAKITGQQAPTRLIVLAAVGFLVHVG